MSKLSTVFVIATQKSAIAELTTGARTLGERSCSHTPASALPL